MVQETLGSLDPDGLDAAADEEVERVYAELTADALAKAPAAIPASHGLGPAKAQAQAGAEAAAGAAEAEQAEAEAEADADMAALQQRLQNL